MITMEQLAIFLLVSIGGICFWGVISKHFKDNTLQRVGSLGMIAYCILRLAQLYERGWIDRPDLWLYASILLFAIGVALKVDKHRRQEKRKGKNGGQGPLTVVQ